MNEYQRRPSKLSWLLNSVAFVLERWPLILILAFFYFEQGPHLYWSGEYREFGGARVYTACTYIGSRGAIQLDFRRFNDDCPTILWIDTEKVTS